MQATTTRAIVRQQGEGEATWFLNSLVTTKASAAETDGCYFLSEHVLTAAANPPIHQHNDEDEAFYVLEGEVTVACGDDEVVCGPGAFVLAPKGVTHSFRVTSDMARTLVITSSKQQAADNGFEGFIATVGAPAMTRELPAPAEPDGAALAQLSAPLGIDIVGPPG
jgi:mannose-6-phosphate isomerase-like protein (cupin superfamily)